MPRWVRNLVQGTSLPREHDLISESTTLDLQCIAWIMDTADDNEVRKTTMTLLMSVTCLAEIVQVKYQQEAKVPNWAHHFTFHALSLDPLPPAPTVVDCLKIIAIDLGCDTLSIANLDGRYLCLSLFFHPLSDQELAQR